METPISHTIYIYMYIYITYYITIGACAYFTLEIILIVSKLDRRLTIRISSRAHATTRPFSTETSRRRVRETCLVRRAIGGSAEQRDFQNKNRLRNRTPNISVNTVCHTSVLINRTRLAFARVGAGLSWRVHTRTADAVRSASRCSPTVA